MATVFNPDPKYVMAMAEYHADCLKARADEALEAAENRAEWVSVRAAEIKRKMLDRADVIDMISGFHSATPETDGGALRMAFLLKDMTMLGRIADRLIREWIALEADTQAHERLERLELMWSRDYEPGE